MTAAEVSDADKRIVQTVQRLSSFDYSKASPKTQEAINRYLDATAGSGEYFTLVEKYQIAAQAGTLLKITTDQAGTPKAGRSRQTPPQTRPAGNRQQNPRHPAPRRPPAPCWKALPTSAVRKPSPSPAAP